MKTGLAVWSLAHHMKMGLLHRAEDYLLKAKELGFDGMALDTPMLPDVKDRKANEELRKFSEDLGMYVDAGTFTLYKLFDLVKTNDAERVFERAKILGSPALKSTFRDVGVRHQERWNSHTAEDQIQKSIEFIGKIEPLAKQYDMPLVLENHIEYKNGEIVRILEAVNSPYIGLLFDTANPVTLMQDPLNLCTSLLDRILLVHCKDGTVIPTHEGAEIRWCPPGQGIVNIKEIASLLKTKPQLHINLELIVTQAWPVPFLHAEYWEILGESPEDHIAIRNRFQNKSECFVLPPTDEGELLLYEDDQLRKARLAIRTIFGC